MLAGKNITGPAHVGSKLIDFIHAFIHDRLDHLRIAQISDHKIIGGQLTEFMCLDIVMPGMSGYQTTRKLNSNESTRHIPVILVSTKDGEADRAWGLRQGATEYVTKPVNPAKLLTAISEAMAA